MGKTRTHVRPPIDVATFLTADGWESHVGRISWWMEDVSRPAPPCGDGILLAKLGLPSHAEPGRDQAALARSTSMASSEPTNVVTAQDLGVPETFNAADYFVDRHVREGRGSKVAIACGEQRLTYESVAANVARMGSALRGELGVRREERVLLLLLDGPEFVYAFFGAMKIGAVPVPVNTLWKSPDYRYVLNDSQARVAIVSDRLLPQVQAIPREDLPHLEHLVVAGDAPAGSRRLRDLLEAGAEPMAAVPTSRDDPALWLYSSGSTGVPKGCVHLQHDMVVCSELFGKRILGITEADRCFSAAKLFFAYGLGNALTFPFAVGATAVLSPDRPTAATVYDIIERHQPTLFFSVPTGFGMLLAHRRDGAPDFDLSTIRHAVSAGEALPQTLFARFKERFGIELLDGLGSTEALHTFISNRPDAIRPGSSGLVVPGYEAKVVDDDGKPVPRGTIGQLLVKGDSICADYWNQPEKIQEAIEGSWLRTGDQYRQDEDGFFWHAGRTDDMLKVGGMWVSPVEVENALLAHPAVRECGVVGRADHDQLIKPSAFVVLNSGAEASAALAEELTEFVRESVAAYKRPRWVDFVRELPRTATGKLQRFKLRR